MILVLSLNIFIILATWETVRWTSDRFLLARRVFWPSPLLVGGLLFYLTRAQFLVWSGTGLSGYLVPPYSNISYFLQYSFFHFWASYVLSFLVGLLILKLAQYFNKKHGEKFFEKEEPYFIGLSVFLVGHPGWLAYLSLVLLTTFLFALGSWLSTKQVYRIAYYNLWLPLAIVAIVIDRFLIVYWPSYLILVFAR